MADDPKELFQSLEDFANEKRDGIYGGAHLMSILKEMARALVYLYKKQRPTPLEQYRAAGPWKPGIPREQVKLHGTSVPLRKEGE
jgi:hypothetical protein